MTKEQKAIHAKLSTDLALAVKNKNLTELKKVAQEIFDTGLEIEEMKVSPMALHEAMENLAASGWSPNYPGKGVI